MECTLIEEILKDPKKRKEISDITTTTTEEAIQKLAKGKAPDHMGLTAVCLSVFFDSFISLYHAFLGSFGEPSISHLWNACFVLLDA
jgi:hypothetical protein